MITSIVQRFSIIATLAGSLHAGTAIAQTASSPDFIANYRMMTSVAAKPCSQANTESEIVVCATKLRDSQRVPYIEELRIGDRPRLAVGEPPGQGPAPPCGPRGQGCYSGPGLGKSIQGLIDRIRD